MHGKFDLTMPIDGSDTQEVCGPIHWSGDAPYDLPAVAIEVVAVFLVQPTAPGGPIVGVATPAVSFTSPAVEWEADVTSVGGVPWLAGPAMALAVVRVTTGGRKARWNFERWNETIALFAP